ncbi:hypothetical protein GCM10010254_22310 [Streptomyces chromofuscus]|nr:hypothetical protein GCM10010254_22310 [Streptomyces chromofuscus]
MASRRSNGGRTGPPGLTASEHGPDAHATERRGRRAASRGRPAGSQVFVADDGRRRRVVRYGMAVVGAGFAGYLALLMVGLFGAGPVSDSLPWGPPRAESKPSAEAGRPSGRPSDADTTPSAKPAAETDSSLSGDPAPNPSPTVSTAPAGDGGTTPTPTPTAGSDGSTATTAPSPTAPPGATRSGDNGTGGGNGTEPPSAANGGNRP